MCHIKMFQIFNTLLTFFSENADDQSIKPFLGSQAIKN